MFLNFFIARKIHDNTEGKNNFSRPAALIATFGIAVGVIIMIVSISVLAGFKKEITSKVTAFSSHAQIIGLTVSESHDIQPIVASDTLINAIKSAVPQCTIQMYASKLGILKTDEDFCGAYFKGVGYDYNMDFFKSALVEGEIPIFSAKESSNKVVVSQIVAKSLNLKVGEYVYAYFLTKERMRARKFMISGIYNTNLTEYDKSIVFTALPTIQRLNNWDSTMVAGVEISTYNIEQIEKSSEALKHNIKSLQNNTGISFGAFTIRELNPQIFSWLEILDTNIIIILVLMLCVSIITVVSGLLIIMLERIRMIGILKTLGATNFSIRNIYVDFSVILTSKGLLIGNIIAIALCYLQNNYNLISLDSSVYYIETVPIDFNWLNVLLLNLFILCSALCVVVASTYLISVNKPAHNINFSL